MSKTISGNSIYIEDAQKAPLINFELEGKTTQETSTQGENLFDEEYYKNATYTTNVYKYTLSRIKGGRRLYVKAQLKEGKSAVSGLYVCMSTSPNPNTSGSQYQWFIRNGNTPNESFNPETFTDYLYFSFYPSTTTLSQIFDNYDLWVSTDNISYIPFVPDMPSPDYPSDIVSVGYFNLLNIPNGTYLSTDNDNEITAIAKDGMITLSGTTTGARFVTIPFNYTFKIGTYNLSNNNTTINANVIVRLNSDILSKSCNEVNSTTTQTFTASTTVSNFVIRIASGTTLTNFIIKPQIEKGAQPHSYISYGKYGIEVKTTGKNLFDGVLEQGSVNSQGINNTNTTRLRTKNYISVYPNTTYALKVNENTTGKNLQFSISYYDKNDYTTYRLSYLNWTTSNPITFTTPNDCHYIRFLIAYTDSSTINTTDNISKIQVEKTQATTYEPYKSNTYLYTLNEPLRAIGNYKDKLYIDNGMLYVERKIKSIILNGSETNWVNDGGGAPYRYLISDIKNPTANNVTEILCNYYTPVPYSENWNNYNYLITRPPISSTAHGVKFRNTNISSLANFKTWLSTHNTEVQYILATPAIEELGEVNIPSTYKGITHIDTTDELEPNMSIEYVNDFSAADKQALQNNTAAIKCKLIVQATDQLPEIELTENNAVKDWTYTDERLVPGKGFIGQFVGRTLEGNLQNISDTFSILNREIKFMFGVYRINDETETWYDFGNFIVTEPENNEVNDNTKFETMDYTKLFNKSFDGDYTDEEYPNSFNALTDPNNENRETVSARWLARYTCKQAGVDLATTSFTNNDFQIDGNPFKAGETCRDVMKAIGQLAFSWVRIGWDNRCYIDFEQGDPNYITTYETIDNDQYFSLKTLETVIPVDGVGFGMKNIDGETALKLATGKTIDTAENIIYLYDNPLLYTFDLRTAAVASADVLFGLTFNQLETETIGHPWLIGSSYINMVDMENNSHYTYAFNNTMKYSGHIRSTINSMYETDIEKTLGYESDLVRNVTDAWIEVNKINGELSAQSKRITDVETGMSDYYTVEQVDDLFVNYEQGFTNIFSRTGGNNKFRNSGLWFEEGSGFEYWTGNVKVATNMDAGSQTSMILQNGTIEQVISGIPNGRYTISFNCKKLVNGATLTVDIDLVSITLGDVDEFEQVVDVTTNLIDFKLTCNVTDGYEVYNLMCNMGDEKTIWSQHQNETRTDTVNISKGITITSTASNATFKANADGIRIENKVNSRVTNFLDDGMETYNAKISGQAEVSGALFTKVGNQTWINGL